jgi:hypothetical protein
MTSVSKQPLPIVFEIFPEVYLVVQEVFSTSLQQSKFKHHNKENKSTVNYLEMVERYNYAKNTYKF